MTRKLLSVCLITHDSSDFLSEAIQSVYGLADEILIVDNMSTDNTLEILHSFPQTKMKIISQKFENSDYREIVKEKRNLCLELAKSDWILFQDPDEIYCNKDLVWLHKTIQTTKKVHIRYQSIQFWHDYEHVIVGPHWDDSQERLIKNMSGLKYDKFAFSISINGKVLAKEYGKDFLDGIYWCKDECKIYHYAMLTAEWKIKRKLRNYLLADNPACNENNVEDFIARHPFFSNRFDQPRHGPKGLWVAGSDSVDKREQILPFKGQHPEAMQKRVDEFHQSGKI